jgi:hypothetical protein
MKLWEEYGYHVEDTMLDDDGNPMVEVTLYLKSNADRHDVVNALTDYLEEGLKVNV